MFEAVQVTVFPKEGCPCEEWKNKYQVRNEKQQMNNQEEAYLHSRSHNDKVSCLVNVQVFVGKY